MTIDHNRFRFISASQLARKDITYECLHISTPSPIPAEVRYPKPIPSLYVKALERRRVVVPEYPIKSQKIHKILRFQFSAHFLLQLLSQNEMHRSEVGYNQWANSLLPAQDFFTHKLS